MRPPEYYEGVKACEQYLAEKNAPMVRGEDRNPYSPDSSSWWDFQTGWYDRMNLDIVEVEDHPQMSPEVFDELLGDHEEDD